MEWKVYGHNCLTEITILLCSSVLNQDSSIQLSYNMEHFDFNINN